MTRLVPRLDRKESGECSDHRPSIARCQQFEGKPATYLITQSQVREDMTFAYHSEFGSHEQPRATVSGVENPG